MRTYDTRIIGLIGFILMALFAGKTAWMFVQLVTGAR